MWLSRLVLASLCNAYTVEWEGEEERIYLKLDPKVAPIKVWVLPVVKKIWDDAKKVYAQLTEDFVCEYDEVWTIGKRYARFDEIWTPFCVTIDSENLYNNCLNIKCKFITVDTYIYRPVNKKLAKNIFDEKLDILNIK